MNHAFLKALGQSFDQIQGPHFGSQEHHQHHRPQCILHKKKKQWLANEEKKKHIIASGFHRRNKSYVDGASGIFVLGSHGGSI